MRRERGTSAVAEKKHSALIVIGTHQELGDRIDLMKRHLLQASGKKLEVWTATNYGIHAHTRKDKTTSRLPLEGT